MTGERKHSELTPTDLNARFRRVYSQLPQDNFPASLGTPNAMRLFDALQQQWEDQQSRGHGRWFRESEYGRLLENELESLLEMAPITTSFRDILKNQFSILADRGILGDDSANNAYQNKWTVEWLLEPNDPESGGIFDEEKAETIERHAFKIWLESALLFDYEYSSEILRGETEAWNTREKRLVNWLSDFSKKYGDDLP